MLEVLSAERIKLARHRAAWWLVWIFPIGFSVVLIGVTIWQMARGQAPDLGPPETAADWMRDVTVPWGGAGSTFGRYLLAGFTAVAFGGEYGWNTWKLVAPHRRRTSLLAAKYAVVLALIAVSLVLMAVMSTTLLWLNGVLTGEPAPQGITFAALVATSGRAGLAAALAVLLAVAYAAAGAILTRSTLAGAIIGIVAVTAESLATQFGAFLHPTLFQALPGYHLANLQHWIAEGEALRRPFSPTLVVVHGWAVSLASYAAWMGTLIAVTVAAFRRQDLN